MDDVINFDLPSIIRWPTGKRGKDGNTKISISSELKEKVKKYLSYYLRAIIW